VATDVKKEHQIMSKLHKKIRNLQKKFQKIKVVTTMQKFAPKKETVVSIAKSQRQMEK
jgi:hypothetical protein